MRARALMLLICLVSTYSCVILDLRPSTKIETLEFDKTPPPDDFKFCYDTTESTSGRLHLVSAYRLDSVTDGSATDLERVVRLTNLTAQLIGPKLGKEFHNGDLERTLDQASKGKKLPVDAHARVLTAFLKALGMQARSVFVMTDDAALKRSGSGHTITEVWLRDAKKWCMADPRFNIIPMLGEFPLNAVELQAAIIENRDYKFFDLSGEKSDDAVIDYLEFIPHRLFYFVTEIDQRSMPVEPCEINGKNHVILVPNGRDVPPYFQRDYLLDDHHVIRSKEAFYAAP